MLQACSVTASIIIVALTTWTVLTHKIKTTSIEILALGLINTGGTAIILEWLGLKPYTSIAPTLIVVGFALLGLVWFVRVEIYPYLFKRSRK